MQGGVLHLSLFILLFAAGCLTPERAEHEADRTAEELTIAAWEKAMGVTNIFGIAAGGDPIAPLVPDTNGIVRLSLDDALRVGAKNNRRFLTLKETVFVRALGHGLPAAWGCMIAHNILLFILYLRRYRGGRWNPLLTGDKF